MNYSIQLQILKSLQEERTPFWDSFFCFLDFFDRPVFYFFLIVMVWFGINYKWGIKIFYIAFISTLVNYMMKDFFKLPRPPVFGTIFPLVHVSGYGFPSGAAQSVMLLSLILIREWKNKWAWVIGLNYIFWISLSRMYLGVHFPTDILGGWGVGILLFLVYHYTIDPIEKWLSSLSLSRITVIGVAGSMVLPFFFKRADFFLLSGGSIGILIGLALCSHWELLKYIPQKRSVKIIRAILGIGSFTLFYFLLRFLFVFSIIKLWVLAFIMGLWITIGMESLSKKILKKRNAIKPRK